MSATVTQQRVAELTKTYSTIIALRLLYTVMPATKNLKKKKNPLRVVDFLRVGHI